MKISIPWLLVVLVLIGLCFLHRDTTRYVLVVNTQLMSDIEWIQNAPHPIHDAQLTAYPQDDGSVVVVVNGRFDHYIPTACPDMRRF